MDAVVDFILSEEPFKFTLFEKTPQAERDRALLLYRECMGVKSGMVILPGQSVLSSSIRSGKYDRKVVVDTSRRSVDMDMKIKAQDGYCNFLVHIDIEYGIRDVKYAVCNDLSHIQNEIQDNIRRYMNEYQKRFSIEEEIEFEREMEGLTNTLINKFIFLYINVRTQIMLDEIGQKVQDSNVKSNAENVIKKNEVELQRVNMQKEGELERISYEEERKILEEKNKLDMAKLERLQDLKNYYGEDALLISAYLNRELSDMELNEQIRKQRYEDDDRRYSRFKQLYDMDIMSDGLINSYASQSVLGVPNEPIGIQERRKNAIAQKDEIEIEDGEKIGNYMDDSE